MDTKLSFGTYNVPLNTINLSASYNAPAILPKEMSEKAQFFDEKDGKNYTTAILSSNDLIIKSKTTKL